MDCCSFPHKTSQAPQKRNFPLEIGNRQPTAGFFQHVPADLRDDEIVISQWLADDLQAGPGSELDLSYFVPDQASQLLERTTSIR